MAAYLVMTRCDDATCNVLLGRSISVNVARALDLQVVGKRASISTVFYQSLYLESN